MWRKLLPQAIIVVLTRSDWDLDTDPPGELVGAFDLCVAQDVFMYSTDPRSWFERASSTCRYMIVQYNVLRKRSGKPHVLSQMAIEFVTTSQPSKRDCSRHSISPSWCSISTISSDTKAVQMSFTKPIGPCTS
jgi:hypothetical protein